MAQHVENGIDHRKAKIAFTYVFQIAARMNMIAPSACFAVTSGSSSFGVISGSSSFGVISGSSSVAFGV